jgi:Mce-associated membrane protein
MSSDEQRTESAADAAEVNDERVTEDNGAEDSVTTEDDGDGGYGDPDSVRDKPVRDEKLMKRLVVGSAALAVAAVLSAGLFGVLWWVAAADDKAELAMARDDVTRVGTGAVQAFTELDYTQPDKFFDQSINVATEKLAKQIEQGREAYKKSMVEAKSTASTKVLDLAVSELNLHEGKASFLAALQVEVKQGDKSSVKPMRVEVQMTRVDEGAEQAWKVSGIGAVPVVGAAQ